MKNLVKCNAEFIKPYFENYGWTLSSQKSYAPTGGMLLTFTGGTDVPEIKVTCNYRIEKGLSELKLYLWKN